MQEYQNLDQQELLDLLAKYTSEYTKFYTEGGDPKEIEKLKKLIVAIQAEIYVRKESGK